MATDWPGSGTGIADTSLDRNRVYAIVAPDTTPTRVLKSASGTVNAQLVNWDQTPVDVTGYDITFDVALNGISAASEVCTLVTPAQGLISFTFPTLDAGVYLARFTVDDGDDVWSHPVRAIEVRV